MREREKWNARRRRKWSVGGRKWLGESSWVVDRKGLREHVSNRRERGGGRRTWEELADTGERLTVAGETGGHECAGRREGKVGRKRHIYQTSVAGGVGRCGSSEFIKERRGARGLWRYKNGKPGHSTGGRQ
jgi:hypothetical protein